MTAWFYRLCQLLLFIIFRIWNRLEVSGLEHLPKEPQGFILAANHVSFLDPPVLGSSVHRPLVFLASEKIFFIKILRHVITMLGALPIAGDSDFRSLRAVTKALKKGNAVVIFPEGTRSWGEEMLKPQPGVVFLAKAANVPIVPCYIHGTNKAWPPGRNVFKPAAIKVVIGKPLMVPNVNQINRDETYMELANNLMGQIQTLKSGLLT